MVHWDFYDITLFTLASPIIFEVYLLLIFCIQVGATWILSKVNSLYFVMLLERNCPLILVLRQFLVDRFQVSGSGRPPAPFDDVLMKYRYVFSVLLLFTVSLKKIKSDIKHPFRWCLGRALSSERLATGEMC